MFDFHTHNLSLPPGTGIVCLPQEIILAPELFQPQAGGLYAAGIHPWWTMEPDFDLARHLEGLQLLICHPQVVQIGECGLDLCVTTEDRELSLTRQLEAFRAQIALSERIGKPMTLHIVRTYDRLLALHKTLAPKQKWTVHGFRGKPTLARQLLAAGMDLSFGPKRNEDAYRLVPPERRWDETD